MANNACLSESKPIRTNLPTMAMAVEIITMQYCRREQQRQLEFMAERQGREFAQAVHDKVKAAGGLKKK